MKAVIYARYSSDRQKEASIEGQVRECKEFAERNQITIVRTYIDRATTARTDNRPSFQEMIKDSNKRVFEAVLVWKLDRFSRDRYDSAHYKRILKKNGVKLISTQEHISEGPEGILMESVLEGFAEYYSAELSQKVKRGMKENALKGLSNGASAPFGYQIINRRYELDEERAPIVRTIFEMYDRGKRLADIVQYCKEHGIRTRNNDPIVWTTIHYILHNRKYIGEYVFEDVVIENAIPPLVDKELFNRVQQKLAKNKKAPAREKAEEKYLLSTKLYCGYCNNYMIGESGTGRTGVTYRYYKCHNAKRHKSCKKRSISKNKIETIVLDEIYSLINNDKMIERLADQLYAYQNKENKIVPALKKELEIVNKKINNLISAVENGLFNSSTQERILELEEQKHTLELSIDEETIKRPILTKDELIKCLKRYRNLNQYLEEEKQYLIDSFINSIHLFDDKVIINFNYRDGARTISINPNSSDLLEYSLPIKSQENLISPFYLKLN